MIALTTLTDSRLASAVETSRTYRNFGPRFAPTVLEIPTLYDEEDAREAGKNLCGRILAQLGPRYANHLLPRKLTVTKFPMLAEIVAREAMRSPFLLMTINGANAVTPEVETFIRRCAAALRRGGAALVVQLYGTSKDEQELSSAYRCLKQIADESKIPIFSIVVELNQSRGAGRASPNRTSFTHLAALPNTPA